LHLPARSDYGASLGGGGFFLFGRGVVAGCSWRGSSGQKCVGPGALEEGGLLPLFPFFGLGGGGPLGPPHGRPPPPFSRFSGGLTLGPDRPSFFSASSSR